MSPPSLSAWSLAELANPIGLTRVPLDRMTEGMSLSREDGATVYTNPAEDLVLGYEPGELASQHVSVQNNYTPGLGPSMVYALARQLEGQIRIYFEVGRGTTVRVYLPRHRGEAEDEKVESPLVETSAVEPGRTVFVVDDEPVIWSLIVGILEDMAYHTLEAPNGPSTLKRLQSKRTIDLLITDVGLSGLKGRQIADQVRLRCGDLKVLFMTGYAQNAALANGFLESGMALLTTPFAVDALTAKLRQLLQAKADRPLGRA